MEHVQYMLILWRNSDRFNRFEPQCGDMWWHVLSGCNLHHLPASTLCLSSRLSLVPKHGLCLHILEPWCYLMLKSSEEFECWFQNRVNCATPRKTCTSDGNALCMGWPSPTSPSRALQSLGLHLDLQVSIFWGHLDCQFPWLRWNQTHEMLCCLTIHFKSFHTD